MGDIPVSFLYNGKKCEGRLSIASGMGGDHWHLNDNSKRHLGQFFKGPRGWQFADQNGYHTELVPVFRRAIYESRYPKLLPLLVDNFYIKLRHNSKDYKILVSQTEVSETAEQFSVIGRVKVIVVESNRPMWFNRMVRHRMDWKHVSGEYKYQSDLQGIYEPIEQHLKKITVSR